MNPLWTPEQDNYLREIAGDVPPAMLAQHYNEWAKKHGYPIRTRVAIFRRLYKLNLSSRACGIWITTGIIAKTLCVPISSVARMFEDRPIARKRIGPIFYIRRDELKRWADRNPDKLGGFPRPQLIMLLENEMLVDSILERFPVRKHVACRLRFPTLGRTFRSCAEAARAIYVDHSTIPAAIRSGRHSVVGIPFEVLR
jgi:hypothetical protein